VGVETGEILRLEVHAIGTVAALRGTIFPLGEAGNETLATCTHCIVAWRACNQSGQCQEGPYFPASGNAIVLRMATQPDSTFQFELGRSELKRVDIDDASLHSTPASVGDETCFFVENGSINLRAEEGLNCGSSYACDILDSAANRQP
jgi:hypothetical protein